MGNNTTRKKLTPVQLEALQHTQQKKALAEQALQDATDQAQRALILVLDAVGLPLNANVTLDNASGELIYTSPDLG